MADNYINPHNTPIDVHSDVAACLQDILLAEKGEEVRGTIFDAIQLMDGRTTALQTWLNKNTEKYITDHFGQLIDETIGTIYLSFECQTGDNIATCNMTAFEISQAMIAGKKILASVHYSGPTRYGLMTLHPAGSTDSSYNVTIRSIYNNNVEKFSFTFHCDEPEEYITYSYETVAIGGGGGGSYTNGDGIDITNDEISVKLRSTDPGLAFDSNGNLYATGGSGGSDFSVFIYHSSSQLYCNHYYSDIYNEVQSRQYPDFNIIVDYHPSSPAVKYYHGQITSCNSSAIRFRFDISTETTTHIVEYVLNSNDELSLDNDYIQENQKKLSSTNAGTGISITNDAQGNPVISLDLPQAEGGGF